MMEEDAVPFYPNIQQVPGTTQLQSGDVLMHPTRCGHGSVTPTVVQQVKPLLGPDNTITICQFCHASIKTAVKYTNTSRTHTAAALWGVMCCLCCVIYSSDSAKNTDHYCPNCQRYLGTYEK